MHSLLGVESLQFAKNSSFESLLGTTRKFHLAMHENDMCAIVTGFGCAGGPGFGGAAPVAVQLELPRHGWHPLPVPDLPARRSRGHTVHAVLTQPFWRCLRCQYEWFTAQRPSQPLHFVCCEASLLVGSSFCPKIKAARSIRPKDTRTKWRRSHSTFEARHGRHALGCIVTAVPASELTSHHCNRTAKHRCSA